MAELKTQREVPTNATLPMQPSSTSRLLQFLLGSFAAWFCTAVPTLHQQDITQVVLITQGSRGVLGAQKKKSRGMALELMTANLHCFGH